MSVFTHLYHWNKCDQYHRKTIFQKRSKIRSYFLSVQPSLMEVHKNLKDARSKNSANHIIRFGDVFNVCLVKEPLRIKSDCLCIMDPSDTFFILPSDSELTLITWHDWILERVRECRSMITLFFISNLVAYLLRW